MVSLPHCKPSPLARPNDTAFPVTFEAHLAEPLPSDETAATHVYRIAQEALTNAMRHSNATEVSILLTASGGELQLEVTDNGCGYPLAVRHAARSDDRPSGARSNGLGLKIMRYRAQMLGGNLALDGRPAGGATVRCTCPLRQATPRAGADRSS